MRRIPITMLLVSFILIFIASTAYSFNNSAPNGYCNECHGGGSAPAYIRVEGLPAKFAPGGTYNATLTIESKNKSFGEVQGGFSIFVEGGEVVVSDTNNTQISYPYLTHTKVGSVTRKWPFTWKAPNQKVAAKLHILGVAANGDFSPAGDSVRAVVKEIEPQ